MDILCAALVFIPGHVLDDVAGKEREAVARVVLGRLDCVLAVMIAAYLPLRSFLAGHLTHSIAHGDISVLSYHVSFSMTCQPRELKRMRRMRIARGEPQRRYTRSPRFMFLSVW
jgi:hypothetical protein